MGVSGNTFPSIVNMEYSICSIWIKRPLGIERRGTLCCSKLAFTIFNLWQLQFVSHFEFYILILAIIIFSLSNLKFYREETCLPKFFRLLHFIQEACVHATTNLCHVEEVCYDKRKLRIVPTAYRLGKAYCQCQSKMRVDSAPLIAK